MNTSPSVSFFERLYLPSSNPLTLEEIIILIRTRRWECEITAYRAALAAGNKEGSAKLKSQLSGFTPSGLFDGGRRGFNREETARFCVPLLHVSDFSEDEIMQALLSAYQGNVCKHDARLNTRRTQKDKKDTATISGEELRERTPFLPETITDNLPPCWLTPIRNRDEA